MGPLLCGAGLRGEGVDARVVRDAGSDAVAGLGANGAAGAGCGGTPVPASHEVVCAHLVDVEGHGCGLLEWLRGSSLEGFVRGWFDVHLLVESAVEQAKRRGEVEITLCECVGVFTHGICVCVCVCVCV